MELEILGRLLPLILVFGGVLLGAGVFRLTAINTFVDHRKTALRNQLREKISQSPYLLVAIQQIGKVPELAQREEELLASIHPAYGVITREIEDLRARAFRWGFWLTIVFAAWLVTCGVLVLVLTPSEAIGLVLWPVGVVTLFGIAVVALLGRALEPRINESIDPEKHGGYLTKAAEGLGINTSGAELGSNANASDLAVIGLPNLWNVQEAMLQSYRQLFATVEAILLVGASILLPSNQAVPAIIAAVLGSALAVIWIGVCRARARAVVFVHWLMRRSEAGIPVVQPYARFREFQSARTHGAIRVLEDPDFRRLSSTLTGRRMDLDVPLLFLIAWLAIGAIGVHTLAT